MGNPVQSIPALPPAIALAGPEQVWINQAGVDRRTTLAAIALLSGGGAGPGGGVVVPDYATLRALLVPPGTNVLVLDDPRKGGLFVPGTGTDNGGTRIVDAGGQTWQRVYSGRIDAGWFYDCAGHYLGDGSAVAITAADIAANPQWIGLDRGGGPYVVGHTWDYVALQQWVYAMAADGSTPGHVVWNITGGNYPLNRPGFCPRGRPTINEQLLIVGTGLDIEFSGRRACNILWAGNKVGTDDSTAAILMDSVDYSAIKNLTLSDSYGCRVGLISIDHTPAASGLSPQANTFENWTIFGGWQVRPGGGITQAAIDIARIGGGNAQGDSQLFLHLFCVNNMYDGVTLNGWNIVSCTFIGGNFQGCLHAGVNAIGGSFDAFGTITEATGNFYFSYPQQSQLTLDGADWYEYPGGGFGASDQNAVIGNRSESMVSVVSAGQRTLIQNVGIVPNAVMATWAATNHFNIGSILYVGATSISVAMAVDDGGPPPFVGDPTSTTTVVVNPNNPGWAVNQWAGYGIWLRYGSNGFLQTNSIVSNTDHTLTLQNAYPVGGANYLYKIFAASGATAPNWNGVNPSSYAATQRNATGLGFTTTVGSNVVSGGPGAAVGNWVVICGAKFYWNKDQFHDAGGVHQLGALIGKIGSVNAGAGTFTVVDTQNNPVTADIALTDGYGFTGAGVVDGGMTWLPLDWDVAWGLKNAIGCSLPMGRLSSCSDIELDQPPYGGRAGVNIRNTANPVGYTYNYRTVPPVWLEPATVAVSASPLNLAYSTGFGGIGGSQTLRYLIGIAACTINFPVGNPGLIDEFDLALTNNINVAITVTWGANVAAAAPTVSLGSVAGKLVIAHMKWMGGAWYVAGLQGPM